ncbi:MAG: hypothetical protein WB580_23550 [Candidatus Binataceae bacterium]|jgi:hypothetical protein
MLALVIAAVSAAVSPTDGGAADVAGKININVACRCPDAVGQNFCAVFKEKIQKSVGYQLAESTSGYGMGVHFACVDMWKGIDNKLAGRMSAVSVSFTIYSDKLPGEVFEDSSVFRVGKDKVPEMSDQIVIALGQLVSANTSFFETMRAGAPASSPEASPEASPQASSEPSSVPSPQSEPSP